jgi:hypothetical protein
VANTLISETMLTLLTLSHSNYFVSLQICNVKARNTERVTCRQDCMRAKLVGSTGCKSAGQLLYCCICHNTSGHGRSHHFIVKICYGNCRKNIMCNSGAKCNCLTRDTIPHSPMACEQGFLSSEAIAHFAH